MIAKFVSWLLDEVSRLPIGSSQRLSVVCRVDSDELRKSLLLLCFAPVRLILEVETTVLLVGREEVGTSFGSSSWTESGGFNDENVCCCCCCWGGETLESSLVIGLGGPRWGVTGA